jgi:mannitol/fructose-specific phosphotransferase system IIA component (Ntr-type)
MSRDHLMPRVFRRLNRRRTPTMAIIVTVGIIMLCLSFSPENIAKLASAFQLLMFAMICLAVIVMREARIESYDPGYRAPFYPWLPIVGIIAPFLFIAQMGWLPILFSTALALVGIAWYLYYGRHRVARHGAIYNVFDRLSQRRFYDLDRELRVILKEKGLRDEDPFDEVVARALVLECDRTAGFESVVNDASKRLAALVDRPAEALAREFLEGTRTGATPVSRGVALPHLRMPDLKAPTLLLVRCREGLDVDTAGPFGEPREPTTAYAIFFLISPDGDPGQHLRLLAQLASRVDETEFLTEWLTAAADDDLREILLRHERYLSLQLADGSRAESLVGQAIRDLDLPEGCLLAAIRRGDETIIPRGRTVLVGGDRLMVIGSEAAIREMHDRFGE